MEKEMRKKTGNQQKDNKDNKTIKRKEMEAKARQGREKLIGANGPKVRWLAAAVAALPARVRAPSGPNFRVRTGIYPQRGTGVRVYRCVVCVRV